MFTANKEKLCYRAVYDWGTEESTRLDQIPATRVPFCLVQMVEPPHRLNWLDFCKGFGLSLHAQVHHCFYKVLLD